MMWSLSCSATSASKSIRRGSGGWDLVSAPVKCTTFGTVNETK